MTIVFIFDLLMRASCLADWRVPFLTLPLGLRVMFKKQYSLPVMTKLRKSGSVSSPSSISADTSFRRAF
jgi:hypothetical protein